ncbi:MAG TPA: hypothetical protein VN081_06575 [Dongiaceae bacterium]|nr:hypothetical protein [Dongiaceae bacterium]
MLSRSTTNAVYDLAQQVTENNIRLVAIDESPLTALINASISPSMASGHQVPYSNRADDEISPMNFIGASRQKNAEGASEHDLVMDELIETVSESVARNLNWTRNDVIPMIELVQEEAQKAINQANVQGQNPYTIVPFFYDAIWNCDEIVAMAEKYTTIPRQSIRLTAVIPLPDGKTVHEVLHTGSSRVDSAIDELLARHGEDWAMQVYETVFGTGHYATLDDQLSISYDRIDDAMLIMLLANQLAQHVPDSINMSLDSFNSYLATILSQAGAQVQRIMRRRQELQQQKVLVLSRPSRHADYGNLIVNGDVYNAWLADGGTPEILMGAVVAGRSENYQMLLTEKTANETSYRAVAEHLKSELAYAKFNALMKSFRESMTQIINNMDDDECVVPRSVYHANLAFRLTRIHLDDVNDLIIPTRKIVCRTLWAHTDAEKYLEAMEAQTRAHPNLPMREAALLAAIDITVEWMMGQLTMAPAK